MRFRYSGVVARLLADTGKVIEPGEVFEHDRPINHPEIEEVSEIKGED